MRDLMIQVEHFCVMTPCIVQVRLDEIRFSCLHNIKKAVTVY